MQIFYPISYSNTSTEKIYYRYFTNGECQNWKALEISNVEE